MWLGYNGTGAYSSTISAATIQMSQQLGIFTRNVRRLSPQGFTPVTELIWGVKEKLTTTGTQRVGSYVGMGMARITPTIAGPLIRGCNYQPGGYPTGVTTTNNAVFSDGYFGA